MGKMPKNKAKGGIPAVKAGKNLSELLKAKNSYLKKVEKINKRFALPKQNLIAIISLN